MDEKKQIEELAYDIYWSCGDLDILTKSGCEGVAERLHNTGYRNCKDKVVLDQEEWETMHNEYAKSLYQARKETAREFACKVKEISAIKALLEMSHLPKLFEDIHDEIIKGIDELEKQYEVEVDDERI